MAEVKLNTNLAETRWLVNDYYRAYVRMSEFERYMGSGSDAIIRTFNESRTDGGKRFIIPLVGSIKNRGVRGSEVLEGNEVDLEQYVDAMDAEWRRNAVKVPKSESYRSNLDLLRIAGPELRTWAARIVLKRGLIENLQGIVVPGAANAEGYNQPDTVVSYTAATAGQRNTFLVNNSDRILFGQARANASSGVFATALATVDATDDRMKPEIIDLAKEMAKETGEIASVGPAITPWMTEDGEEWYVMWVNRRSMRDLRNNSVMREANREAMERGKSNPLFRGGDLLWNGVVIKEISDLDIIPGAGASGVDVAQNFLVGQSALAVAWGQRPRLISDNRQDYEFRPAKAIEELIGIKKTSFNGKQYGVVSVYTAAPASA